MKSVQESIDLSSFLRVPRTRVKNMIKMVDKQDIIFQYRREGKSIRAIARALGLHRNTVTKVVREYESSLGAENPNAALDMVLTREPSYHQKSERPKRVVKGDVEQEIDRWLSENERRRSKGMRKQCLNAKEIHRQLLEKDLVVSYSSVCKYISKVQEQMGKPRLSRDVYIHQEYDPGIECEFDWCDVKLEIRGELTKFIMAVFTFCHSNGRYGYIFRHQDALALMEAHRNFFKEVQGVPEMMVYDNMRVAVAFTEDGKKPTLPMQRLTNFYRFAFRFCNARAGWEKGHVERSVEVVRSRAFKPRTKFDSIEEAQEWLTKICRQMNTEVGSLSTANKQLELQEDLNALMPYPGEMGCFELIECSVDKLSTIVYKYNHYSVPDTLNGQNVLVKVFSEKLVIYDNTHKKVAEHERSYLKNDWKVDINHYLNTLLRKPGALPGSTALKQMPQKMQDLYRVHFKDKGHDFLLLLRYAQDNSYTYEEIVEAASLIKRRGARHLSLDQLKVALHTSRSTETISGSAINTDEYLEISLGSDDILTQLSSMMCNR